MLIVMNYQSQVARLIASIQVLSVIALLSSSSWTESRWVRPFYRFGSRAVEGSEGDDNRATMRRLIEEVLAMKATMTTQARGPQLGD
jgi:hypothetical protein